MKTDFYQNSDIFNNILTMNDLFKSKEELEKLSVDLFTSGNFLEKINQNINFLSRESLLKLLMQNCPNLDNPGSLEKVIEGIRESLNKIPIVTIIVAFNPSQGAVEKISDFICQSFSKRIVIDIKVDSEIIGGVKIIYEGNIKDFSIKRLLDRYFQEQKGSIQSLLHE